MKALFFLAFILLSAFTNAQVSLVKDLVPGPGGAAITHLTEFNGKLYFYTSTAVGQQLWCADQSNNVNVVSYINPNLINTMYPQSTYRVMCVLNGKLYFAGNNDTLGCELWVYDGVHAPKNVADIETGAGNSDPGNMATYNGKLYFTAKTTTYGQELYEYDPNTNITKRLTDVYPGSLPGAYGEICGYNGKIYFEGRNAAVGFELFVYDPNTNTTNVVADINPGPPNSGAQYPFEYNGKLYFVAGELNYGREIYSYDSLGGIVRLTDIRPGPKDGIDGGGFFPFALKNNFLYFSNRDPSVGWFHLWKYNLATGVATQLKLDWTSEADYFTWYKNKLYFEGYQWVTGSVGAELWYYDDVSDNVYLAADIYQGYFGSQPNFLTTVGNSLYFTASRPDVGPELFKYNEPVFVNNVKLDNEISVYPNPADDFLYFRFNNKNNTSIDITLTDILGRNVITMKNIDSSPDGIFQLPISDLSAGSYFYAVISNDTKNKGIFLKK